MPNDLPCGIPSAAAEQSIVLPILVFGSGVVLFVVLLLWLCGELSFTKSMNGSSLLLELQYPIIRWMYGTLLLVFGTVYLVELSDAAARLTEGHCSRIVTPALWPTAFVASCVAILSAAFLGLCAWSNRTPLPLVDYFVPRMFRSRPTVFWNALWSFVIIALGLWASVLNWPPVILVWVMFGLSILPRAVQLVGEAESDTGRRDAPND